MLAAVLAVASPADAQSGTDALRRAARAAEARYERTARFLAPGTYRGRSGQCDEVVGRFCLTFDSTSKPPQQPERREVGEARERAVASQRAVLAADPGDLGAAGTLVRLLVEADRAEEAVAAARTFAAVSPDPVWSDRLEGFALHAAGRDSAAALLFERVLARLPAGEREAIESLDWLLTPAERKRVERLPGSLRAAYPDRFWRLADPMWLTTANEVRVAHMARHVHARLLARVPPVQGMLRWGRDLDELTVRYGAPVARERDYGSTEWSFIEHFDTAALAYAPESLLGDGLPPPAPGAPWPLKSPSARSSHAPPAISRATPLAHQLTRFPAGDSMRLRLDARAAIGGGTGTALLAAWVWQSRDEFRKSMPVGGDTVAITLELVVPRDSVVYGAEVYEPAARVLQRARHFAAALPRGPLQLSDVLLTEPAPDSAGPAGQPPALTSLLLPSNGLVGVLVAVHGVQPGELMEVEVSFARADSPSLLARAVGWAGRQLGLARESRPPRVRWHEPAAGSGEVRVNVRVPARRGLYFVQVAIRAAAGEASNSRLIRVVSASAAGS